MNDIFYGIFSWIKDDYKSHPLRFSLEVLAWALSIGCSIAMAVTVPNPPLIILYPIWITGCAIYAWCAYNRRSFGMLANYVLLTTIDSIGLIRMLIN
jgi:cellulose synthase/poly-beta-1,6-N-acetylglucosamine synthase-like glycosyltransferase